MWGWILLYLEGAGTTLWCSCSGWASFGGDSEPATGCARHINWLEPHARLTCLAQPVALSGVTYSRYLAHTFQYLVYSTSICLLYQPN